ncbi:hypothetical protein [uncultured Cohaesibacter sp.]|uniref:hypothetical protein n=1 Tax=uncultured Cohaesibacter sp. TaxID=1002546 RepID=UPI002AA9582E|nr:hypothetical protein [uncultured Cohaesibacter sp.]
MAHELVLGLVVGVSVIGFGLPSLAADMPRYDPEGYCKEVASFGGDYSAMLDKSCLEMEQTAYNALKTRWDGISSYARSYCNEVALFGGGGSYNLLKSCIAMEEQAADSKKEFKF